MKQTFVFMVLLGTLLAVAAGALAALPKKSATYVGDVKASPFTMHIDMKVNPAGTKLQHFTYLCGTGRPPTTVFGVAIDRTGHFVSATKAFVSLNSIACGGSKGSTTLTLKA